MIQNALNTNNIYHAVVEFTERTGVTNKEIKITCEPGKKPTIGDYIAAFKESGLEVDITDFSRLVFKPKLHAQTPVVSLKIVRTYQVI